MYLVDTDILIWIIRGERQYVQWFEDLKKGTSLSISSVTIAEIYKNVFPSELVNTEAIINDFTVWDVTGSIAKQAGLYWQQYTKRFKNLSLLDCMIAATAREHDLTLLSLNLKHFPMKDIKMSNLPI